MSASLSWCWLSDLDVRQPALGCTYLLLYHENLLRMRVVTLLVTPDLKILIKENLSTGKVFY
ncbi:MAG: hypothetical protein ACLFVB_10000 [Thermoplasmata archaeon]